MGVRSRFRMKSASTPSSVRAKVLDVRSLPAYPDNSYPQRRQLTAHSDHPHQFFCICASERENKEARHYLEQAGCRVASGEPRDMVTYRRASDLGPGSNGNMSRRTQQSRPCIFPIVDEGAVCSQRGATRGTVMSLKKPRSTIQTGKAAPTTTWRWQRQTIWLSPQEARRDSSIYLYRRRPCEISR